MIRLPAPNRKSIVIGARPGSGSEEGKPKCVPCFSAINHPEFLISRVVGGASVVTVVEPVVVADDVAVAEAVVVAVEEAEECAVEVAVEVAVTVTVVSGYASAQLPQSAGQ